MSHERDSGVALVGGPRCQDFYAEDHHVIIASFTLEGGRCFATAPRIPTLVGGGIVVNAWAFYTWVRSELQ
jgi:hypothetical protein